MKKSKIFDFHNNQEIMLFGEVKKIVHTGQIRGNTYIDNEILYVAGLIENLSFKVRLYLKETMEIKLREIISEYEILLKVCVKKISIRINRSRWGSCNSKAELSFNLLLVFLPSEYIEYVVIHEMAHILEMNHSSRFWRIVAEFCPEYKTLRHELKMHYYKYFSI